MTVRRLCIALAFALPFGASLACAQSSRAPTERKALIARLDSLTRSWLAGAPAAGVTVGVIRGSDTLLLEGVGERDREKHLPATTATVYRIGSITKQFTAAAIMQLVDKGRIALSDPVTKYLPEYPQWRAITVRQLLNHTSGIHSVTSDAAWARTWNDDLTPAQLVAFVAKDTLDFAPGTEWRYNNTGYILLGMILDRVTGEPYPHYIQTQFFTPLGLRSATYCPSHITHADHALGYDLNGKTIKPAQYISMTHPYSAGALCMSVPDYLRWQTALTSGRVVTPASYRLMSSTDTLTTGKPTNYGFGLATGSRANRRAVGHGGAVNGFNTEELWLPDDSLRVVVFTNTAGSDPAGLENSLILAVLGIPLVATGAPPPQLVLAAGERPRYVGIYDLKRPDGGILAVHIFEESGALLAQAEGPGQGKIPLLYYGDDTFGAAFDPTLRITIIFEGGRAVRARLLQRGGMMEGTRRP